MQQETTITHREREVLELLIQGMSNKQIGHALGISVRTIDTHLRNLRLKTGSPNRAALSSWWTEQRHKQAPPNEPPPNEAAPDHASSNH